MSSPITAPEPIRSALRNVGALTLGVALTSGVLFTISSIVGAWS